ncbi:MAG: dipeptidase [Promethearchaeota archaeon]
MSRSLVIDCHADTLLKKYLSGLIRVMFVPDFDFHVSKELLIEGGVDVQVFAIFVPSKVEKLGIEVTLEMISLAKEMEKEGVFTLIKSKSDLRKLESQSNTIGMILSMEGAIALERNLKLLPIFYELGVRNIGLVWSRKNLFCEGVRFNGEDDGEGLSFYGEALIEQMENLGMVIDVSHLNNTGFKDVVRLTSKPFIASHSNSYKVCPIKRNLNDEQLMDIESAEGVVGINFCRAFLNSEPEKAGIHDVIKHIVYISEIAGVDSVGLGSDFDGIPKAPEGLENAAKIKKIPTLLEEEGFSQQDISKIMGKNFQRVFEAVWK